MFPSRTGRLDCYYLTAAERYPLFKQAPTVAAAYLLTKSEQIEDGLQHGSCSCVQTCLQVMDALCCTGPEGAVSGHRCRGCT